MSTERVVRVREAGEGVAAETLHEGVAAIQAEMEVTPDFPPEVDEAAARAAAALPDDAALLLGFGKYRQLWLGPTALELRLFGPPQRG